MFWDCALPHGEGVPRGRYRRVGRVDGAACVLNIQLLPPCPLSQPYLKNALRLLDKVIPFPFLSAVKKFLSDQQENKTSSFLY